MKKQVIAVMLSIMMAAGSIGGIPVLAAEEAATAGTTMPMEVASEEQPEQPENSQESEDAEEDTAESDLEDENFDPQNSADESTEETGEEQDAVETSEESLENADASENSVEEPLETEESSVSQPEPIDFQTILTDRTGIYYAVKKPDDGGQEPEWKKIEEDTVLTEDDVIRVYLAYTIPAGSLNETNTAARYRFPLNLHLTDAQIEEMNNYENGFSLSVPDDEKKAYSRAEAIEGTRTPDESTEEENISAVVKAEQVYDDSGEYAEQFLVFQFVPYTVAKNRNKYDPDGNLTEEGEPVQGFFSVDLKMDQIDFDEHGLAEIVLAEDELMETLMLKKEGSGTSDDTDIIDNTTVIEEAQEETYSASAAMSVVKSGSCGKDLIWTLEDDGTLTIRGTGEMYNYRTGGPFENYYIKEIIITDGVTSIGSGAFYQCLDVTSATIPNSVTSIGDLTFGYCSSLTSVTIPSSVTSIEVSAFFGCSNLKNIIVESENLTYSSEDGVLFNKDRTEIITFPFGREGSYSIPERVTSIGNCAFHGCKDLTSVTIPNSVTSIGKQAFYLCSSLTSVTIPSNVTSIEYGVFYGCSSLTSVTIPDNVTSIGDAAFLGCSGLTSVTISNSVTSIGSSAFSQCSGLTSVTIPNSVTSIGSDAFAHCSGLTSVTIPSSVTSIRNQAFYGCSSLTSVTIPDSVTSIDSYTFCECSGLISVTIPDSVTSIGERAFSGCISLTSVTIPSSVTSIGDSAFSKCDSLNNIFVESENPAYGSQDGVLLNKERTEIIQYPKHKEGSYSIPESVTSIGERAFYECSGLTSVTIPGSVTSIGNHAFETCKGLTSVTIPGSVTSIGDRAFYGCSSLKNVTISSGVESIGASAFERCSSLTSVTIPDSVKCIESYTFSECSGLTSVTIPNSVTSIESNAFSKCYNLTSVTISESVTRIADYAFYRCSSLTSVTIPNSVTSIESYAFSECYSLTSVTISESVTRIADCAFSRCSSLASIYFDRNAPDIDQSAFTGVTATAYYPSDDATWTEDKRQNYNGTITWIGSDKKNIDECDISLSEDSVVYTGKELQPEVVIKDGAQQLAKGQDYTVQYESNVNAGTAAITITGKGEYTGTVRKTFTITKASPVLEFTSSAVAKKDTDGPFTNELTKTTDGTVTFKSGNTSVAEVDSTTGEVTVKGAGTAMITAAAAEGTNYTSGSASYTLTVTEAEGSLTLENLTYSFANSAKSFGYPAGYEIPLSSYQAVFGNTTKAAWYYKTQSTWGGSCMGFSSTAALLYDPDNGIYPSGFNPGAGRISDLKVQDENSAIGMNITRFIEAMQISQKTLQVKNTITSNRVYTSDIRRGNKDLNVLYSTVQGQTKANKPVIIAVYQNGGHAILAYKTEDVSETESRIHVYDNNYPSSERYITLNKDSAGNYTSWSYDMGGYGVWGTSDSSSSISYIPYSVIEHVWTNRGDVNEIQNIVRFNSRNIALFDADNKLAATIVDGQILTNNSRIRLIEDDLEAGGSSDDGYTLLSMPIDVYTVKNLDTGTESLELAVVDTNLGASVDTTAKEVTFVVDDSNDLNSILIKAEEDDSYRIELNSSFEHGHDMEIKGSGSGETMEVSQESGYISIINCQIMNLTVDGVEVKKYTVSASAGEGGSISPSGESTVIRDMDTAYTITPDSGYVIEDVKVDGKSVGAVSSYTFKQVRADHTISASFMKSVTLPGKTTRGDMFNLANNVKVTWKAVPGAKYYKVYREGVTDPAETRKEPVIVTAGLVGWDKDPGLTNGHAYRYKIVASLTGKGDSSGDSTLSYSKVMYRLKTVVIRSVKNTAPGKVTVKYDKTASGDSYVLQYCERQDMVGAKTKVVLGASNTSYVIGGLKKGKTYYISIRVRKKVNGIDYYTTFGVPKKVTITR